MLLATTMPSHRILLGKLGPIALRVLPLIGIEEVERLKALPMFKVHDTLTVAMAEPQFLPKIDRLKQLTGCNIHPVLALEANIMEFVKKYAGGSSDVNAFLATLAEADVEVIERRLRLDPAGLRTMLALDAVVRIAMNKIGGLADELHDIYLAAPRPSDPRPVRA